jgi:hypothetical protein
MNSTTRLLIPLFALALLAGGCFAFGPRVVRVPDAPERIAADADPVAYLRLAASGSATVTRGSTTVEAVDGVGLISGDRIRAVSGDVSIVYPESGMSKLDSGTEVVLLAGGEDGTAFTEMQLMAGNIWTRFEKLFGPNEQFSVNANGVVATVRGTAFGVSMDKGVVDVMVADHEVDVTSESLEVGSQGSKDVSVRLVAGKGLRLSAEEMTRLKRIGMMARVRDLTPIEKQKVGFLFMMKKLNTKQMERPASVIRMEGEATIPAQFERRMDFLRERVKFEAQLRGFVLPTRGVESTDFAPSELNPSVEGPTTTMQVETNTTLEIR